MSIQPSRWCLWFLAIALSLVWNSPAQAQPKFHVIEDLGLTELPYRAGDPWYPGVSEPILWVLGRIEVKPNDGTWITRRESRQGRIYNSVRKTWELANVSADVPPPETTIVIDTLRLSSGMRFELAGYPGGLPGRLNLIIRRLEVGAYGSLSFHHSSAYVGGTRSHVRISIGETIRLEKRAFDRNYPALDARDSLPRPGWKVANLTAPACSGEGGAITAQYTADISFVVRCHVDGPNNMTIELATDFERTLRSDFAYALAEYFTRAASVQLGQLSAVASSSDFGLVRRSVTEAERVLGWPSLTVGTAAKQAADLRADIERRIETLSRWRKETPQLSFGAGLLKTVTVFVNPRQGAVCGVPDSLLAKSTDGVVGYVAISDERDMSLLVDVVPTLSASLAGAVARRYGVDAVQACSDVRVTDVALKAPYVKSVQFGGSTASIQLEIHSSEAYAALLLRTLFEVGTTTRVSWAHDTAATASWSADLELDLGRRHGAQVTISGTGLLRNDTALRALVEYVMVGQEPEKVGLYIEPGQTIALKTKLEGIFSISPDAVRLRPVGGGIPPNSLVAEAGQVMHTVRVRSAIPGASAEAGWAVSTIEVTQLVFEPEGAQSRQERGSFRLGPAGAADDTVSLIFWKGTASDFLVRAVGTVRFVQGSSRADGNFRIEMRNGNIVIIRLEDLKTP